MFKTFLVKAVLSKLANAVLFLGDLATAKTCTLFFHEVDIPEKLKNDIKY